MQARWMTLLSLGEYALFVLIVVALVRPVGTYLDLVFSGRRTPLDPALVPVERAIHRLAGVDPRRGMDWREYALSFVLFGVAGTTVLFLVLTLQPNHQGGAGVGARPGDGARARHARHRCRLSQLSPSALQGFIDGIERRANARRVRALLHIALHAAMDLNIVARAYA